MIPLPDILGAVVALSPLLLWPLAGVLCLTDPHLRSLAARNALGLGHLLLPVYLMLLSLSRPPCFSDQPLSLLPDLFPALYALLALWLLWRAGSQQAAWATAAAGSLALIGAWLHWQDEQTWRLRAPELTCDLSDAEAALAPLSGEVGWPLLAAFMLLGYACWSHHAALQSAASPKPDPA